jgi:hypothetical protein
MERNINHPEDSHVVEAAVFLATAGAMLCSVFALIVSLT